MLWACASGPRAEPAASDPTEVLAEYVQLRVGSTRTYQVRFPGQEGKRTVRILGIEDGFIADDQGGALKITSEGLRDRDRYLIRLPLEAGTEWQSVLSASAVERYRIRSVGRPCEVAAGRFQDCLVVESGLRRDAKMSLDVTWTWIRGVGLGRIETRAIVQGVPRPATLQDLVHFDLDGGTPPTPEEVEAAAGSEWGR